MKIVMKNNYFLLYNYYSFYDLNNNSYYNYNYNNNNIIIILNYI